jgi:hypothetical protein
MKNLSFSKKKLVKNSPSYTKKLYNHELRPTRTSGESSMRESSYNLMHSYLTPDLFFTRTFFQNSTHFHNTIQHLRGPSDKPKPNTKIFQIGFTEKKVRFNLP